MPLHTDTIDERVLTTLRKVTMQNQIDMDQSFYESGIDSIISLELIMRLEREFHIEIPDSRLPEMMSPRSVIELIREISTIEVH